MNGPWMDHDHVTLTDWAPQSFAFPWQSLGKEFIHGPVLSDLRDSLSRSVSFRCISCRKNASYCLTMGHVPNKYQKYGQTYPYIQYIYIIIYIYVCIYAWEFLLIASLHKHKSWTQGQFHLQWHFSTRALGLDARLPLTVQVKTRGCCHLGGCRLYHFHLLVQWICPAKRFQRYACA